MVRKSSFLFHEVDRLICGCVTDMNGFSDLAAIGFPSRQEQRWMCKERPGRCPSSVWRLRICPSPRPRAETRATFTISSTKQSLHRKHWRLTFLRVGKRTILRDPGARLAATAHPVNISFGNPLTNGQHFERVASLLQILVLRRKRQWFICQHLH